MPPKDKYTDPDLREQVKEEIKQSDKGGEPGQWSARKAQMMAQEYKKRGGDYTTDKSQKDESQQNLSNWGDEEWQTKDGSGDAKKEDGTEKRYLPKKAWEKMSEEEKEATDEKKQEESKEGKQFVENTDKAKAARKEASKEGTGKNGDGNKTGSRTQSGNQRGKTQNGNANEDDGENDDERDAASKDDGDDEEFVDDENVSNEEEDDDDALDQVDAEEEDDVEGEGENDGDSEAHAGEKRKAGTKQPNGSSKKQKNSKSSSTDKSNGDTVGSKHMPAEEPAPRGSATRLPTKGQQVHWKAMPGYVDGEVVEVITQNKEIDGKLHKASEDEPKVVLKSNSSGKICVHKPDSCFFDQSN